MNALPAILDAHVHAFPTEREGLAFMRTRVRRPSPEWSGTIPEHRAVRSAAGVRHSNIMMLTPTGPLYEEGRAGMGDGATPEALAELRTRIIALNRANNWWAAGICEADPTFSFFCGLNPRLMTRDELFDELEACLEMGALGVKMAPVYIFRGGDAPEYEPLWEYCEAHDVPVLLQSSGRPPASGGIAYGHPQPFGAALAKFPRLRLLFAHLGMGAEADLAELTHAYPHVYTDFCLRLGPMEPRGAAESVALLRSFGLERVTFASNFPLDDTREVVRAFIELPFSDEEQQAIASSNLLRFLGMRGERLAAAKA